MNANTICWEKSRHTPVGPAGVSPFSKDDKVWFMFDEGVKEAEWAATGFSLARPLARIDTHKPSPSATKPVWQVRVRPSKYSDGLFNLSEHATFDTLDEAKRYAEVTWKMTRESK